ncbi:Hypp1799 [Branchiostoma lanceolatum]|uniref:Hypp1799 protein n=1 Tax=Branchiostoma lanceolatum TaxID=7740 RepID=A0A8J9ZKR7_BRALA|nr:Hypp1799 [Branchiostoma lanceolatum]
MQHFKRAVSQNLKLPTGGPIGWLVKELIFLRTNDPCEVQAAKLLNIQPHHQVLEVGFGPGVGLKEALGYIGKDDPGKVYGLELSPQMVHVATKRLQPYIASGKLQLTVGDVMNLPYPDGSMDRIFHVNCFYFWDDLHQGCRELYRVLSPGGAVATTMNRTLVKKGVDGGLNMYARRTDPEEYMKALERAGFVGLKEEEFGEGKNKIYGYTASKEGEDRKD